MENLGDFLFNTQESDAQYGIGTGGTSPYDPSPAAGAEASTIPSETEAPAPPMSQSDVFKMHFTKQNIRDGGKKMDVICNYCGKVYAFKKGGGYGSFAYHMRSKHPDKMGMMRGQSQLAGFEARPGSSNQGNQPYLFNYNHIDAVYNLSESICVDQLAFNFAENLGFNDWVTNHVQPAFKKTTRKTVKKCVMKAYMKRKLALIKFFSENDMHVSICSDIGVIIGNNILTWALLVILSMITFKYKNVF